MPEPQERLLTGIEYLETVTTLQQRVRNTDPTAGTYEAADHQWWWRAPRSTDNVPQLFWFDDVGPVAAAVTIDCNDRVAIVPIVMPDAPAVWVEHVLRRGLTHAGECGFDVVDLEVEVNSADKVTRAFLVNQGFTNEESGLVETWLAANARPTISELHPGYQLSSRASALQSPHHMISRNDATIQDRLRQTSLYRPELDLVVHDSDGDVAAYGLFWYDPATATGLVEPMRTEDDHQGRGLARHILTTGVDLLAKAGAKRVKICFDANNPVSKHLYLSVGFEPTRQTTIFTLVSSRD